MALGNALELEATRCAASYRSFGVTSSGDFLASTAEPRADRYCTNSDGAATVRLIRAFSMVPSAPRVNFIPAISSVALPLNSLRCPLNRSRIGFDSRPSAFAPFITPRPRPSCSTSMPMSPMAANPAGSNPPSPLTNTLSYCPVLSSKLCPPLRVNVPALPTISAPICTENAAPPTPVAIWPTAPTPVPTMSAIVQPMLLLSSPFSSTE